MSRDIKFRVWNVKTKKLINSIKVKEMGVFALQDGLLVKDFLVIPTNKDFKIMQYTGLKDKNDVEIYEGDIIHHDTDNDNYEVVFVGGCFCWVSEGSYDALIELTPLTYKVIGNIYENKELLK